MPSTETDLDARSDRVIGVIEVLVYLGIGVVLVAGAVILLGTTVADLVDAFGDDLLEGVKTALDTILLTFIFVELLGAVRKTIREGELIAEPFLLVGIIASIKEIVLLVGTEDASKLPFDEFRNGMIELGVLAGLVLVLSIAALLLRRKEREPEEASS